MPYTIGEVARKVGITASTLRYYDKEGLLRQVARTQGGVRAFTDADLETLRMIECLKSTGMPIRDIRQFMDWCQAGDSTLERRREMFHERRQLVLQQMEELRRTLATIEYKCWFYEQACKLGSSEAAKAIPPEEIPEGIRCAYERLHVDAADAGAGEQ